MAAPTPRKRDPLRKDLPHVDYALARRRVLRDVRRGILTRLDVCDAHPELLRVAANHGHETIRECPVCADEDKRSALYEVGYLYGDGLKKQMVAPSRISISFVMLKKRAKRFTVISLKCAPHVNGIS